jgi:hypothetical protein
MMPLPALTTHTRSYLRALPALLLTLTALVTTLLTSALAQAQTSKTIAVYIEGSDSDSVRASVLEIVPKTLKVMDADDFKTALGKAGAKGPFGGLLATPKKRDKLLDKVRKAAKASGVEAVVMGQVRKSKSGGREVYLLYVDAIPGDLAVDEAVALKEGEQTSAIKGALGPSLEQLAPAETTKEPDKTDTEVKPPTDTATPDEPDEPSDFKPHDAATALFVLGVNFELGGRNFEYSDPLEGSTNLRPYSVFGAPLILVNGEVYPAAMTDIPVLNGLGITGTFAHAFGLQSATEGGEPIGTTYDRYGVGLRLRFRVGGEGSPVIAASGGFGVLKFEYDDPTDATLVGALPDVSYKFLKGGVDGLIPVAGIVNIVAGFDYIGPLDAGAVYDRFTMSSVGGIDVRIGLAFPVSMGFEARLMAEYTRMFYAFEPVAEPRDMYIAGGALDQYLGISAGAAYVY